MEEFVTTYPMVILRKKGRCRLSSNLIIREAVYDTARELTVLPLHQIKTFKREMKRQRMVCLTNTPGEDDGIRLNLESSPYTYTTDVKENQCRIVAKNRIKKVEVKQNMI